MKALHIFDFMRMSLIKNNYLPNSKKKYFFSVYVMYIPIHKYIHFVISLLCIKLYFYNSKMSFQLPIEIRDGVFLENVTLHTHIY